MRKKYTGYILIISLSLPLIFFSCYHVYAQQQQQQKLSPLAVENITISDPNLKLELVTSGLDFPTTMAFLDNNDFLILEKSGTVKRVVDGQVLDKPLLQVDVSTKDERGLLGIAIGDKKENSNSTSSSPTNNKDITHNVFLYYTICNEENEDCNNQIYRYDLDNKNNALINPKLLIRINTLIRKLYFLNLIPLPTYIYK